PSLVAESTVISTRLIHDAVQLPTKQGKCITEEKERRTLPPLFGFTGSSLCFPQQRNSFDVF
ncbi:hypothetical protein, partial [Paenibacillus sp. FSL R7-0273]|uniref:hypothetical protein n=1 Tax=Paenibacillus sp. FSL R7-0273 TaxID=1536772 RepID=UPI001C4B6D1F